MLDKTTDKDKINHTISSLIEQLDYLVSDIQIDKTNRDKKKYDITKDKIRSDSDTIFQLSNSLSNLIAIREHLSTDKITSLIEIGLGTNPKGDKKK